MLMVSGLDDELVAQVVAQTGGDDPRLIEIVTSAVRHLHAFAQDVRLTEDEWLAGVLFLTAVGRFCTERRQEFILLSDMLGFTTRVDDINHVGPASVTPSSVEGPFHSPAPARELGAVIAEGAEWVSGERAVIHGRVLDSDGNPLPGATLDVWQADDKGEYDTQDDLQPNGNLRGLFTADEAGAYWFRTVEPATYPVPTDGPVGGLLHALGRHPMRPAHLHVKVEAAGFPMLTTHVFVAGDPHLGDDAAFAVKDALITEFVRQDDPAAMARYGMDAPYLDCAFDFVLHRR